MTTPPDLKELYGSRYKVRFKEEDAEGRNDPWAYEMPCKLGIIYPHGAGTLAVEVDYHPVARRRLTEMGLRCTQDGDQEATFVFPLEQFDQVAAVVQPRRRRVLSEEEREALIRRTEATRFSKAGENAGRKDADCGQGGPISPEDDSRVA